MSRDERWAGLVKLHMYTKHFVLLAEELGEGLETKLQIVQQLALSHEHTMRAWGIEHDLIGGDPKENEVVLDDNLDSAIKHEYRAFWDAADWASVSYRKKINDALQPYSQECIKTSIPTWYPEIRLRIEEISVSIAKLREGKDGAKNIQQKLDEAENYSKQFNDLKEFYTITLRAIPSMKDYKKKEWANKLLWIIVAAIAGGIITCILKLLFT